MYILYAYAFKKHLTNFLSMYLLSGMMLLCVLLEKYIYFLINLFYKPLSWLMITHSIIVSTLLFTIQWSVDIIHSLYVVFYAIELASGLHTSKNQTC